MDERVEIRIAGSAGQGVVTAGKILARAAMEEGKHVSHVSDYGAAVRFGVSKSDIIISEKKIDYPLAEALDYLLLLSQEAYWEEKIILDPPIYTLTFEDYVEALRKCSHIMKKEGTVIVDSDLVHLDLDIKKFRLLEIPIASAVLRTTGYRQAINVASLGVLVRVTKVVLRTSLEKAIMELVPERLVEINLRVIDIGFSLADKFLSE